MSLQYLRAGFSWKKLCNALPAGELPCKRWGHSLLAISDTEARLPAWLLPAGAAAGF